jgi:hypothetical protein
VRKFFRATIAWAALAAWLLSSGVSADLLQVVAYANMTAQNARSMSAPAALAKAMQDAPCGMCKVAAAARQASEQSPLAKQEAVKSKVKPDGDVWSVRLPSAAPAASPSFVEILALVRCPEMIREVPVPPPKANA